MRGSQSESALQAAKRQYADHKPPLFDVFGTQLPKSKSGSGLRVHQPPGFNTLNGSVRDNRSWVRPPPHSTVSQLKDERRKEMRAHDTFDLDGDGVVSPMDFFLAKQFDKDGDGILNAEELANAKAALAAGYKDRFTVIKGPAKFLEHRVMQRRGVVLSEEIDGWHPLTATFTKEEVAPAYLRGPIAPEAAVGGTDEAGSVYAHKAASNAHIRTRSDLLRARRHKGVNELRVMAGEPLPPGGVAFDGTGPPPPDTNPDPFKPEAGKTKTSRDALLKARKRDMMLQVMGKQGIAHMARPETPTSPPRQDPKTVAATRSQLFETRALKFGEDARKLAPTKPPGVHKTHLPTNYSQKLNATMTGWWQDKSHLEGETNKGEFDDGGLQAANNRRHTSGHRAGKPLIETGAYRPYTPPDDVFKTRVLPQEEFLAQRAKKRSNGADKPFSRDLEASAAVRALHVAPQTPNPKGINAGPPPKIENAEERSKPGKKFFPKRRWTDVIIEFQAEGQGAAIKLDEKGKLVEFEPNELDPVFSSFSRMGRFDPQASVSSSVMAQEQAGGQGELRREIRKRKEARLAAKFADKTVYGVSVPLPGDEGPEDDAMLGGYPANLGLSAGGGASPAPGAHPSPGYGHAHGHGHGGPSYGSGGFGGGGAGMGPRAQSAVGASRDPVPQAHDMGRPASAAAGGFVRGLGHPGSPGPSPNTPSRQSYGSFGGGVLAQDQPRPLTATYGRRPARGGAAAADSGADSGSFGVRSGGFQLLGITKSKSTRRMSAAGLPVEENEG